MADDPYPYDPWDEGWWDDEPDPDDVDQDGWGRPIEDVPTRGLL